MVGRILKPPMWNYNNFQKLKIDRRHVYQMGRIRGQILNLSMNSTNRFLWHPRCPKASASRLSDLPRTYRCSVEASKLPLAPREPKFWKNVRPAWHPHVTRTPKIWLRRSKNSLLWNPRASSPTTIGSTFLQHANRGHMTRGNRLTRPQASR